MSTQEESTRLVVRLRPEQRQRVDRAAVLESYRTTSEYVRRTILRDAAAILAREGAQD